MFEDLNPSPATARSAPWPDGTGFLFPEFAGPPAPTEEAAPVSAAPAAGPLHEPSPALAMEAVEEEMMNADFPALADWKFALRGAFEKWLETLDEIPEEAEEEDADAADMPDLYSFYQQLAAANTETRKSNRRTAEAFNQWGEILTRFEGELSPLRGMIAELTSVQSSEDKLSRKYCLVLVEFLDRLHRLARAFAGPPKKKGWWSGQDGAWREAWERQRQGFTILISHFEELLKREEVVRIDVMGQPFDPTQMTAVAVEPGSSQNLQTVLEEVAPGYFHAGELLRPAQVKVSAGAGS